MGQPKMVSIVKSFTWNSEGITFKRITHLHKMADTNTVLQLNTWKKRYKAIFEPILGLDQIRLTRSESRTESTSQVNRTLRTVVVIMAWDSLRDYRQEGASYNQNREHHTIRYSPKMVFLKFSRWGAEGLTVQNSLFDRWRKWCWCRLNELM